MKIQLLAIYSLPVFATILEPLKHSHLYVLKATIHLDITFRQHVCGSDCHIRRWRGKWWSYRGPSLGSHRQQFETVFQHFKTDTVFVV